MKISKHRIFFVWQHEKEEAWINKMAADGWNLTDVSVFRYVFEKSEPGKYLYRLELLRRAPSADESMEYIEFMESVGIKHIASYGRWVYFRKENDGNGFDLFSDINSKIDHLRKILIMLTILDATILLNVIVNFVNFILIGNTINLVCSIIVAMLSILLTRGIVKIFREKRKLDKMKLLHE